MNSCRAAIFGRGRTSRTMHHCWSQSTNSRYGKVFGKSFSSRTTALYTSGVSGTHLGLSAMQRNHAPRSYATSRGTVATRAANSRLATSLTTVTRSSTRRTTVFLAAGIGKTYTNHCHERRRTATTSAVDGGSLNFGYTATANGSAHTTM